MNVLILFWFNLDLFTIKLFFFVVSIFSGRIVFWVSVWVWFRLIVICWYLNWFLYLFLSIFVLMHQSNYFYYWWLSNIGWLMTVMRWCWFWWCEVVVFILISIGWYRRVSHTCCDRWHCGILAIIVYFYPTTPISSTASIHFSYVVRPISVYNFRSITNTDLFASMHLYSSTISSSPVHIDTIVIRTGPIDVGIVRQLCCWIDRLPIYATCLLGVIWSYIIKIVLAEQLLISLLPYWLSLLYLFLLQ
jgi:hypothetical protein